MIEFDPKDWGPPVPWDPCAIDWKEIEELRQRPGMEKVYQSLRLQELAREFCMMGIRHQHPTADEAEVLRLYDERLEMLRKFDSFEK